MNRKPRLGPVLCLALACTLLGVESGMALEFSGNQYFGINIVGPVSVRAGAAFSLQIIVKDKLNDGCPVPFCDPPVDPSVLTVGSLQIVVIDPFSGARVYGPQEFSVNKQFTFGEEISQSVSILVPVAYRNKSLAVIVSAVDENSIVRGTAGWGIFTR